jgi:hypothetical protein
MRSGIRSWSKWKIFSRRTEVLQQRRPPFPGAQAVLVVGYPVPEIVSQVGDAVAVIGIPADILMELAAIALMLIEGWLPVAGPRLPKRVGQARRFAVAP